jgi:hypothetical protein
MAALLAAATLAHAEIDPPAAENLVRKSGLWEQLSGVAAQIQAGLQQAMDRAQLAPADSEKARIARVIARAYAADRLRATSTGIIAARMQPQDADALGAWFDSPLGQAVAHAEEAISADTADSATAMKEGLRVLASTPSERRKLLDDLLAATHAAEGMVQLTISTRVAVQLGAASAITGVTGPSATQARAALEPQRPQMLKAYTALMLSSFARSYVSLSSEQLSAYVAFIRSPAGAAFNDVSLQAMEAALTAAATEMGRSLPGTRDGRNI